jgi:flagellar hook assembly protein FlgD
MQLSIYNVRGELVRTLLDDEVDAGEHVLRWDGRDATGASASSGVYLYELRGFGKQVSRKMMLIK